MGAKENKVKQECLLWLAEMQIPAWENNTGSLHSADGRWIRFGYKGSPDIFALLPDGRLWSIECKTEKGRQEESQKRFQAMVERTNAPYTLARSKRDVELVLPALAADFENVARRHSISRQFASLIAKLKASVT